MTKKPHKKIKLLIIATSVDGGTGTYLMNLLDVTKLFGRNRIEIQALVLERPTHRTLKRRNFTYLHKKRFYPQKYSLAPINFINFTNELIWVAKKVLAFKPSIILSVDFRCNLLAILSKIMGVYRKKLIATCHIDLASTFSEKSTNSTAYFLRKLVKNFYQKPDIVVCVSKGISEGLRKDFGLGVATHSLHFFCPFTALLTWMALCT